VGFIERIMIVLSYHRQFATPEHMSAIQTWWEAVSARASVRVVTAPRSTVSVATQAFEETERTAYLKEMYATYAADDLPVCRSVMAESGEPQFNAYRRFKQGLQAEGT
jgi:hypothetical protein